MVGKIIGMVGGKWGVIAILAAMLTIAGLYGFIKYQSAVHEREEIELRSNLRTARRDIEDRNRVINVMTDERELFGAKVQVMTDLLTAMQGQFARNSQQRGSDYQRMTRPRPAPGQPADIVAMEQSANQGMNSVFDQMEEDSKSRNTEEKQ